MIQNANSEAGSPSGDFRLIHAFARPIATRVAIIGPRLAFALSLAVACPAIAQPQAPAAAPATPAPANAPITPTQLAAGRALVIASGMARSFSVVIPQFVNQIGGSLTETRPELTEDLKAVFESLRPEFEKQADEMTDIAAQIFAKHMSEVDLNAAVAFFDSPPGKQYVAAQPLILTDIVTAMQGWQGKVSTNMMTRVREEMKKKGHDI
jgi:hypothetical protein